MKSPTSELAWVRGACKSGEARRIRTEAGVTLAEVAAEAGVSEGLVSKWERQERSPRTDVALVYAGILRRLARRIAQQKADQST